MVRPWVKIFLTVVVIAIVASVIIYLRDSGKVSEPQKGSKLFGVKHLLIQLVLIHMPDLLLLYGSMVV